MSWPLGLEKRLDPERFIRIHRSAIVNRDRIRELLPEGSSRHTVVLDTTNRRFGAETRSRSVAIFGAIPGWISIV